MAAGLAVTADALAQCPVNWDPGHLDGPIGTVFTVQAEAGLGFAGNVHGAGRGRRSEAGADPWYIGLDLGLYQRLGPPSVHVLAEARYGRAFSIGRQHLNTGIWDLRGAILFGPHVEDAERPWMRVLDSSSVYAGMDGAMTTTYRYCRETSAYRKSLGYGVGVQADRLTGTPGLTVNGVRVVQVARDQTLMFELYGLFTPSLGLSGSKYGGGALLRLLDVEGTLYGGALEAWSSSDGGGALLITAFVGGGGVGP